MKYAAFHLHGQPGTVRIGEVSADSLTIFELDLGVDVSESGVVAILDAQRAGKLPTSHAARHAIADVRLLAPIPRPRRNVFCVGKNYFEHAREFAGSGFDTSVTKPGDDIPSDPIIFTKVPECVIAPGAPIRIPSDVSTAIDYEAELAVIIGEGGRRIPESQAMAHVWGYTIVNDVTARDWQHRHKQWHMGKSFDTFCPMGPWVVTADDCNGQDTTVRCWVNGELRQNASTRDLIFNIPKLIATISAGMTLMPGDIIATGTPVGVGIGFKPPRYLVAGDRVRIAIDGIGEIENPCEPG